jgi:hypothetical protein
MLELYELTNATNEVNQLSKDIKQYVDLYIYKTFNNKPNVLINSTLAYPHTFIWYTKNDFNQSEGLEKIKHLKILEQITE